MFITVFYRIFLNSLVNKINLKIIRNPFLTKAKKARILNFKNLDKNFSFNLVVQNYTLK